MELLGAAVDASRPRFRGRRARQCGCNLRAELFNCCQFLGGWLLPKVGACLRKERQHVVGIELRLAITARLLRGPDQLIGSFHLARQLGEVAINGRKLALQLRNTGLQVAEPLFCVLGPLFLDLVFVLQPFEFGHPLAVNGATALLAGALNAALLRKGLDAFLVDLPRFGIQLALVLGIFSCEPGALTAGAGQFLRQRSFSGQQAGLPALGGGFALLLLCNSLPALLELLEKIGLDLAR